MPDCPHHLTQRGNERRDVFFSRADREIYLGLLQTYARLHGNEVLGFCLMTNHVHLVVVPHGPDSLAKFMREVQMRYSQYRHAVERGSGHLWQGRYYSCAVDPDRLGSVMRYVELNPVRAGLREHATDYEWSSARIHVGEPDPWDLVAIDSWRERWKPEEWREILRNGSEEAAAIREATYSGRPFGSKGFVGRLEDMLNRPLHRGKPGRPRKEFSASAAVEFR